MCPRTIACTPEIEPAKVGGIFVQNLVNRLRVDIEGLQTSKSSPTPVNPTRDVSYHLARVNAGKTEYFEEARRREKAGAER